MIFVFLSDSHGPTGLTPVTPGLRQPPTDVPCKRKWGRTWDSVSNGGSGSPSRPSRELVSGRTPTLLTRHPFPLPRRILVGGVGLES